MIEEVIKFAKYYVELGYNLDEAITTAINIVREVEIGKYEYWWVITALLKFKNEGCKDVTIDPRKSKVCDRYGYINLRDKDGNLRQKIRIIRK